MPPQSYKEIHCYSITMRDQAKGYGIGRLKSNPGFALEPNPEMGVEEGCLFLIHIKALGGITMTFLSWSLYIKRPVPKEVYIWTLSQLREKNVLAPFTWNLQVTIPWMSVTLDVFMRFGPHAALGFVTRDLGTLSAFAHSSFSYLGGSKHLSYWRK